MQNSWLGKDTNYLTIHVMGRARRVFKLAIERQNCKCPLTIPISSQSHGRSRVPVDVYVWSILDKDIMSLFHKRFIQSLEKYSLCASVTHFNFEEDSLPSLYTKIRSISAKTSFSQSRRHIHIVWPGFRDISSEVTTILRCDIDRVRTLFESTGHRLIIVCPCSSTNIKVSQREVLLFKAEIEKKFIYHNTEIIRFDVLDLPEHNCSNIFGERSLKSFYFDENGVLSTNGWRMACTQLLATVKEKIILMCSTLNVSHY